MKHCQQCHQLYDEDSEFCVSDGSSLVSAGEKSQSRVVVSLDDQQLGGETPTQYVSIPQKAPNPQTTPNNSNLLYAVIGGLVAVILMGGAYLLLVGSRKKDIEKARVENSNVATNANPANVSNIGNNATGGERNPGTHSEVASMKDKESETSKITKNENTEKEKEPPETENGPPVFRRKRGRPRKDEPQQ